MHKFDSDTFGSGAVYGCDFAGTAIKLGKNANKFAVGDFVGALIRGGKYKNSSSHSSGAMTLACTI
jgi:NADPH:quinone reductase-like Zn-dependent oxidoreductase